MNPFFKIIVVAGLFISSASMAKSLTCLVQVNDSVVSEIQVETMTKQKIAISEVYSVQAFVTEKVDDIYILEAFIGNEQVRIYGEGMLRTPADRLVASLWSRGTMADIECSLRK